ncbi:MAG: carbohydrate kinase family protein [Candidatus Woesearchaeota archaeon]
MFNVICVGGAVVDLFVNTASELITIDNRISSKQENLIAYPVGSKLLIKNFKADFGGGAFNAAVSFARLNLKTGFLGCLSKDENGIKILKRMNEEKIKFLGHFSKEYNGFSIILDSRDEERTILTYRGCNDDFDFEIINKNKIRTKWFYLSSFYGKSFESAKKIVDFAAKNKIHLAFNPSTYIARLGFKELKDIIKNLDIIVLNKQEANFITEKESVKEQLLFLKNFVRNVVVVTDGKNGAYAYNGNYFYRSKVPKVKVKETTGAGDAFASSFVYGMIKRTDVEFALKCGICNSISVVQNLGAQNILLQEKELLKRIKRYDRLVKKSKTFID